MHKTVVLLSGGMDSAVALAGAVRLSNEERFSPRHFVLPISFQYGQKHSIETVSAQNLADFYGLHHKVVDLPKDVFAGSGSALVAVDSTDMPSATYEALHDTVGPSPTYVPFRNANLISMAVAYALTQKASLVVVGAHAEDAHNFAYPDCTPEFMGAMSAAIWVGTYYKVSLQVPFQHMSKADIVRLGLDLDVPFHLTNSCYQPVVLGGKALACGTCPTCRGRLEAFKKNDVLDPVGYVGRA